MTTLLTGASGFVGSAVLRKLLARGEAVRVLLRPGADRRNLEGFDIEIAEGDLTDPDSLHRAVRGCHSLFHAAADYRLWAPDPQSMYQTNVAGSETLIRAACEAGATRIVYTSSVAVLGINADGTPGDEKTPVSETQMIGPYKHSKFLGEARVRALIAEEAAPVVIVNPSTPIGPRDVKPTPTGKMIVEAAAGRMPAYVQTGLNIVHVDDVAEGHLLAYDKGQIGERYILGGTDLSLAEILTMVAHIVGRKPPQIRLPHALVMPLALGAELWARMSGKEPFATVDGLRMARKLMFFSSAKAKTDLGYHYRPPEEALRDAIDWFKAASYLD